MDLSKYRKVFLASFDGSNIYRLIHTPLHILISDRILFDEPYYPLIPKYLLYNLLAFAFTA